MAHRSSVSDSVSIFAALLAVAMLVGLLGAIPNIDSFTAGFSLLVLVLLAIALAPMWIAVTVAVGSALAFNYAFFPPIGTFTFTQPQDSVSVLAYLATALVAIKAAAGPGVPGPPARHNNIAGLRSLNHDLKTPLTAIVCATENLRHDLPPAERLAQADAAITELDRLTRLLERPSWRHGR